MLRVDLLKGLLRENGDGYREYAEIIGRSVTTVQDRLKGKTEFTYSEMEKTRVHYNLSDERFMNIFFNK